MIKSATFVFDTIFYFNRSAITIFAHTFTREGKMSVIKIACFMLIFLNLKSKPRHLFWGVASSLSILYTKLHL